MLIAENFNIHFGDMLSRLYNLIGNRVGKVKSLAHKLPSPDWCYGKASSPDLAGVKELT